MDAEGSERERALERRIARLEARLYRLERQVGPPVEGDDAASSERSARLTASTATPNGMAGIPAPPYSSQGAVEPGPSAKPPTAEPPHCLRLAAARTGHQPALAIFGQPAAPALAQ